MKETELAAKVIDWLRSQNWDIYQEVQFYQLGSVADIVAIRNGIMWIIECKTSYGFAVLNQASSWTSHYRSVAIPMSKNHYRDRRDYFVARDYYRVGVLEVDMKYDDIHESIKAPLIRENHKEVKIMLPLLDELQKTYAPAGSANGNHLTPYKRTMIDIREYIEKHPGCTVKDLYNDLGEMHYANINSFKGNIIKALDDFEPWCRIEKSSRPYKLFIRELEEG